MQHRIRYTATRNAQRASYSFGVYLIVSRKIPAWRKLLAMPVNPILDGDAIRLTHGRMFRPSRECECTTSDKGIRAVCRNCQLGQLRATQRATLGNRASRPYTSQYNATFQAELNETQNRREGLARQGKRVDSHKPNVSAYREKIAASRKRQQSGD